jgi:hypothetical protein
LAGLAVAAAPFLGSVILARFKDPKYVALTAASVSALQFACVWKWLPETLEVEKRKPVDVAACNPFSFVRFYCQSGADGAKLRILSAVAFISALRAEMHDTRMVVLRTKLGFGATEIGRFMLGNGLAVVIGGIMGRKMVTKFGSINATFVSYASAIGALLTYSAATRAAHIPIAQVFSVFEGGSGIDSMLTTMAVRRGMGRGEIAASLANQTTLTKVLVPMIYASLFGRFGQKAPFRLAALFVVLAALLFRTPLAQQAALEATKPAVASQKSPAKAGA